MGTIYVIKGIRIFLHYREHNPPHIHAIYAEYEVELIIKDGQLLEGEMPKAQLREIRNWLSAPGVKEKLTSMFHKLNPHLRK